MKILYAASNNLNSKIQLFRFVEAMKNSSHQIKIAAYKKSSPNINIDWTLDFLMKIFNPNHIPTDNEPFQIYFEQVKRFNPDLIISDLEYFTSYIGNVLNVPIWQCGSSLINFAMTHDQKYNLGFLKKYGYLFYHRPASHYRNINMLDNSSLNLVYSHLCDTNQPPLLKENFEWIRPYYIKGKESILCKHNIIAGMINNNKKIFSLMRQYPDCVAFTEFPYEEYENILLKNISNQEEYACNLYNSNLFICDGSTNFLADAFYNGIYSYIFLNINDVSCILNSLYSEKLGLSKTLYDSNEELYNKNNIIVTHNTNVKFLHEKIADL